MAIETVGTLAANDLEPEQFRRIMRAFGPEGTLKQGDYAVTANGTPNMSVNVAAGEALVQGDSSTSQGVYYVRNDATVNLSISAASGSNPRRDLIILEVLDSDYTGASDLGRLRVVTGTPASSPALPSTPVSSIPLADVTVPQSASSIVSGNVNNGVRYRSGDVQHQYIVNNSTTVGILGASPVTIVSGTVTIPGGWTEYDCHFHGRIIYDTQSSSGTHNRYTTSVQAPSGSELNQGRVSTIGVQVGVSAFFQDPVDAVVTGLTGNLSFRYQATLTDGSGGSVVRSLVIATLNRTR